MSWGLATPSSSDNRRSACIAGYHPARDAPAGRPNDSCRPIAYARGRKLHTCFPYASPSALYYADLSATPHGTTCRRTCVVSLQVRSPVAIRSLAINVLFGMAKKTALTSARLFRILVTRGPWRIERPLFRETVIS